MFLRCLINLVVMKNLYEFIFNTMYNQTYTHFECLEREMNSQKKKIGNESQGIHTCC